MRIEILSLHIRNFKGIKSLDVEFSDVTKISGDNGTGKTTIFDAFTWCLFGKDSTDRKDFNIKYLDENNEPTHRLEHEVEVIISVDGMHNNAKRTFKEKWVKPTGSDQTEFRGHETAFHWNDVPLSQKDFKEKVESICSESVFKMLTSTGAFNELPWKSRREILFNIAGEISDKDIADQSDDFAALLIKLSNKTLEEYRKELAANRRRLKGDLAQYPTRIDEVKRGKPEAPDFDTIKKDLEEVDVNIDVLNKQKADSSEESAAFQKDKQAKTDELYKAKARKSEIEHERKVSEKNQQSESQLKAAELDAKIKQLKELEDIAKDSLDGTIKTAEHNQSEYDRITKEWNDADAELFEMSAGALQCPTCKRELEDAANKRKELEENFNTSKSNKLKRLNEEGQQIAENLQKSKKAVTEKSDSYTQAKTQREFIEKERAGIEVKDPEPVLFPEEYDTVLTKIENLTKAIEEMKPPTADDNAEAMKELNDKRSELVKQLAIEDQIKKADARVDELEAQEKNLAQQIADIEKQEHVCDEFTRTKITAIEEKINSHFGFVKFKMFDQLINGGSEETCETLVNGVPFSDINSAARINAGLAIIRTLSKHYDIQAPIFVDNSESVNQLLATESQIIKLIVTKEPTLNINHG